MVDNWIRTSLMFQCWCDSHLQALELGNVEVAGEDDMEHCSCQWAWWSAARWWYDVNGWKKWVLLASASIRTISNCTTIVMSGKSHQLCKLLMSGISNQWMCSDVENCVALLFASRTNSAATITDKVGKGWVLMVTVCVKSSCFVIICVSIIICLVLVIWGSCWMPFLHT